MAKKPGPSPKVVGGLDYWIEHQADPSATLGMTIHLKAVIRTRLFESTRREHCLSVPRICVVQRAAKRRRRGICLIDSDEGDCDKQIPRFA